jgi:uncharacterized alkaline shock family protein YloU
MTGTDSSGTSPGGTPTPPPQPPTSAPSQTELAERVATLVRSVPGVVGLHGGVFGEVATYLPGRRVSGIRITPERAEVHVTLVWGEPVRATAEVVRDLVAELTGVPVFVTVEDVVQQTHTPAVGGTSTDNHAKEIS